VYRHDCTHSYCEVMESRKDEKATADIPSEAKMSKRMDAWIGSGSMLILEGDGRVYPSEMAAGSGSGILFWLKNEREDEDEVNVCWNGAPAPADGAIGALFRVFT